MMAERSKTCCRYGSRTREDGGGGAVVPVRIVVSFFAAPGAVVR
jgi:hypothetical protein